MKPSVEKGLASHSSITSVIKQLEVQDIKQVDNVRNAVKVAVLEGDSKVKDLLAISYYDSKPCYFLSTVIDQVSWNTYGKNIFSKIMQQKVCWKHEIISIP